MRTNLRPCERSDRALYVLCPFANPLSLVNHWHLTKYILIQMDKERHRREIRISRSRHKASCTVHHGRNQ
jgi:hypothetical protein